MRFEFKIELVHTFTTLEEMKIEVEAKDIEEAESIARNKAYSDCDRSSWDAEHDESSIEHIELINTITEEGEEPLPIRCDETPDMFGSNQQC